MRFYEWRHGKKKFTIDVPEEEEIVMESSDFIKLRSQSIEIGTFEGLVCFVEHYPRVLRDRMDARIHGGGKRQRTHKQQVLETREIDLDGWRAAIVWGWWRQKSTYGPKAKKERKLKRVEQQSVQEVPALCEELAQEQRSVTKGKPEGASESKHCMRTREFREQESAGERPHKEQNKYKHQRDWRPKEKQETQKPQWTVDSSLSRFAVEAAKNPTLCVVPKCWENFSTLAAFDQTMASHLKGFLLSHSSGSSSDKDPA